MRKVIRLRKFSTPNDSMVSVRSKMFTWPESNLKNQQKETKKTN